MKVIGLTGGIGSGKSTVARLLSVMGYPVYDSDSKAKALYRTDPYLRQQMCRLYGDDIYLPDGQIDRIRLSAIAFSNEEERLRLNAIVHPAVVRDFQAFAARQKGAKAIFFESALLVNDAVGLDFDAVWAVCAPLSVRLDRAMQRDGASREAILARIQGQGRDEDLRQKASCIIENGANDALIPQVIHYLKTL